MVSEQLAVVTVAVAAPATATHHHSILGHKRRPNINSNNMHIISSKREHSKHQCRSRRPQATVEAVHTQIQFLHVRIHSRGSNKQCQKLLTMSSVSDLAIFKIKQNEFQHNIEIGGMA